MKLKIKDVNLSTGGPVIAILNQIDATNLGVNAGDRVVLSRIKRYKDKVIAVVDISTSGVEPGEIGLFEEVLRFLDVEEGTHINVELSQQPKAIQYIKNKLLGKHLTEQQIKDIVQNVVSNKFSEVEMTYFVSACFTKGLDLNESAALTKAIVESGTQLTFEKKVVLDKHCIGGVPNNRTTMIVVPIIAALGFTIPKTSSRSITSPAGTADTMEVLAPVALSEEKIKQVVNETNGCIVWGGTTNLAAADDKLIKIRHPLRIDPEGMLLASILAKKKAVGATHVLIDIPYGYGAKFETKLSALVLGKKFSELGKRLGMNLKVVYTDGSQPVGNGIGPALEAADVITVMQSDGPNDLREKSVHIATQLLRMINVKDAHNKVLKVLNSGQAYDKFIEIVKAQGGRKCVRIPKAKYFYDVVAKKDGKVRRINNKGIARLALTAGAPADKVAGIYLRVHRNTLVRKGDVLFTLYSNTKAKLNSAVRLLDGIEHVVI